jgi:hypothetical protein
MTIAVYFAQTYFSPYYFPRLPFTAIAISPGYRDRDAFVAIATALADTGEFANVILASSVEHAPVSADRTPLAVIAPNEWSEVDDSDPIVNLRQVAFTLTLVVRDDDAHQRFQLLDRLTSIVQNAVDGLDLGGGCLPNLTRLSRGRFDPKPKHPEQKLALSGFFSYLIPTYLGHDTTN